MAIKAGDQVEVIGGPWDGGIITATEEIIETNSFSLDHIRYNFDHNRNKAMFDGLILKNWVVSKQ